MTLAALKPQMTWGDALVLKVHRSRVGLNPLVEAIRFAVGRNIGSRNTFAKLYDVTNVNALDSTDRYRAWLLLSALGCDPRDWGIGDDAIPPSADAERVLAVLSDFVRHQGLEPRTRCVSDDAHVVTLRELVAA